LTVAMPKPPVFFSSNRGKRNHTRETSLISNSLSLGKLKDCAVRPNYSFIVCSVVFFVFFAPTSQTSLGKVPPQITLG
jgi:hypothetical protein